MGDPLNSPAVALLCELEQAALDCGEPLHVSFTAAGTMRIAPKAILTPSRVPRIKLNRDDLAWLVRLVLSQDAEAA